MKKGLKKILAATTALALLLSMGMTAMAAEYTTVTTYDANGVHVVTTVNAATAEKEYTYLVSKTDTVAQDSDIVFIDQKQATGTSVTFNFTTELSKLNFSDDVYSAVVQVGTNASDVPVAGAVSDITGKTISFSAVNGVAYVVDSEETSAITFKNEIVFKLVPAPGYKVGGMKINNVVTEVITDGIVATYTADVSSDDTFVFEFAKDDGTAAVTPTAAASAPTNGKEVEGVTYTPNKFNEDTAGATRQLTYFGNVTGDAKEFGILVSKESFTCENGVLNATADVMKYAAAGKSNSGNFAISLYETKAGDNFTSLLADDSLYVAVYAVGADGVMKTNTAELKGLNQ